MRKGLGKSLKKKLENAGNANKAVEEILRWYGEN
jgi:hypothetical protein